MSLFICNLSTFKCIYFADVSVQNQVQLSQIILIVSLEWNVHARFSQARSSSTYIEYSDAQNYINNK